MSSVINTNSLSLVAQNNLNKSQGALNSAIERLSSGMRINSAKDDAAGQAIANRFTANIKGLTQASRNANDGISLAQTTEGALSEINSNLQRVRELTVQSANGANSAADKTSIQAEITQRLAEIDRTSQQTDFNGTKVLNANVAMKIQVGAQDGQSIDINLQKIDTAALTLTGFNVDGSGTPNKAATSSDLLVSGFSVSGSPVNGTQQYDKTTTVTNAASTSANVFSKLATNDTVAYTGTNTGYGTAATSNTYTYNATTSQFTFATTGVSNAATIASLTPNAGGTTAATVTTGSGTANTQSVLISSGGAITAADDGATLFLDTVGNLSKTNTNSAPAATLNNLVASMSTARGGVTTLAGSGGSIVSAGATLTIGTTGTVNTAGTFAVTGASISASALKSLANVGGYTASIAGSGPGTGTATVASGAAATGGAVSGANFLNVNASGAFTASATTATTESFYAKSNGNVMDNAGNQVFADSANAGKFTLNAASGSTITANALSVVDAALAKVDMLRGSLGAVQNRFDSVISNLGITINNLTSSRSRIEDANYATEVSNMGRAQILQQAGTSVLAQANQTTQGVLSLLR